VKTTTHPNNLWEKLRKKTAEDNLFTWDEFKSESIGFLIAGFETTSNSLCWILWALAKHPEVKEKLKRELKEVLGDKKPTAMDLPRLPYLDKVIHEAFRMYGSVNLINRATAKDERIEGFSIPSGTQIFMCPGSLSAVI